jgi:hypothetical protein
MVKCRGIATVNKEMHIDILCRLSDAVKRKRQEKYRKKNGENNSWFFLLENAPAHQSVLIKDFLANNNVTVMEHPPFS